MDLLCEECASDSSATTDSNPAVKPSGNAQDSVSSAPAAVQNQAEAPSEVKPAAQQLSDKSGTSTSVGNHRRLCAACKESKSRDEYSKNQWSKPAGKGRCKPCVGAPARPPRPAAAKRQKLNPKRNQTMLRSPDDIKIQVKFGKLPFVTLPFVIDKKKTANDLKLLVCSKNGLNPGYCHFVSCQTHRPLKSSFILEDCPLYRFAPRVPEEPSVELICQKHPSKLDHARYLFDTDSLAVMFRNSCPFRTIGHPNDIHDLVGNYDIICDVDYYGRASHDINLEALPGLRMEIRPRGTDHIEGSVFGRCLGLFSSDRDYITFNTDTPYVSDKPEYDINSLTDEYSDNCQIICAIKHEFYDETSLDYDSDDLDIHIGSIFVLKQKAFIPRSGLEIPPEEEERLLNEYNNAFGSSFLRNHLTLPDSVVKNVFDYWRTEPPPCLTLEKGDVFITVTCESRPDDETSYVIARRNQEAVSRFEAWKRQETKKLLLGAPPVNVAAYPFEEEFQRLERRKRRGLSR